MTSKLHPYLAIDSPVPPLPTDSGDLLCFRIEERWVPYILTLLKTFIHDRTWASDQDRCVKEGHNLISQFILQGECEPGVLETDDCVHFSPAAPFIDWAPTNPYTQPEIVPDGFIGAPWFIWPDPPPSPISLGLQTGDVVTGIFGMPVLSPVLGTGLARFRVNLVGSGTVELHFVAVGLGSIAIVVPDDNPLKFVNVDLNLDFVATVPETNVEVVTEVTFDTPGAHHIDVTFVPIGEISEEFLNYGGGIRSIVLCGFDEMTDLYTIRQNPTEPCKLEQTIDGVHWTQIADITKCTGVHQEPGGNIVITIGDITFSLFGANTGLDTGLELDADMKIRKKPTDLCVLQIECAPGEWTDWYDPRGCFPGAVTQPPPAGEVEPGGCLEFDMIVLANMQSLIPTPVSAGDTIEISSASGGWTWDGLDWRCPNGQYYTLGFCGGTPADAGSGFPLPTKPKGRLAAKIDGVFYDAYNTIIGVPGSVSGAVDVALQMNDDDFSSNSGSISVHVKVCRQAAAPIGISYLDYGTGPSSANIGDTFVVNSEPFGGENVMHVRFSQCVQLEVVSVTNFTHFTGGGDYNWDWFACDESHTVYLGGGSNHTPANWPDGDCLIEIGATSQTSWFMVLKIVGIDC